MHDKRSIQYKCVVFISLWLNVPHGMSDASDPEAAGSPVEYRSVVDEAARDPSLTPLPWRRLFDEQGNFVPESQLTGTQPAEPTTTKTQPMSNSTPSPDSDGQGTIVRIDQATGKVKIKHGPITRLDMPGMTMLFTVDDTSLLETVKEGDEVGFTVDVRAGKFFITGFQK